MAARAVTCNNILDWFFQVGYIDRKRAKNPDFNHLLATCRRDPTHDEYNVCKNSFTHLQLMYANDGHIEDKVYQNLGFPFVLC